MSSLDLTLLRVLKHREKFDRYARVIPADAVQPHTKLIIADYGKFYTENPEAQKASEDAFIPWFLLAHPKLKDEPKSLLLATLKAAQQDVSPELEGGILQRLTALRLSAELTSMLEQWNNGEDINITARIREMSDRQPIGGPVIPYARPDMAAMLTASENDWGFKWRLSCLNNSMRAMGPGDFGILAARVDQGKTTMLASELTFMAPQVDELFPGQERTIIILNNEGPGDRIVQRLYQAALGMTIPQMIELSHRGELEAAYLKACGGRRIIEVLNVHDRPLSYLEDLVAKLNPAIVVTDMLDVCPFDGTAINGGQRTDQILEAAYQRGRLWAVKYDTVHIATSQLSAGAAGELYPGLDALANSKTGKAGAADFIVMMGSSNDPLMTKSRWISLPKNKLARPGSSKDPRCEVTFWGDRARLEDQAIMQEATDV
jgi:replicative DNA helicase